MWQVGIFRRSINRQRQPREREVGNQPM